MASAAQQSHLNPVTPENLLDPIAVYKALREEDPVHWEESAQAWFITRYSDVSNCFRDSRLSADRSIVYEHAMRLLGLGPSDIPDLIGTLRQQLINQDGARHLRLRRQSNAGFTPQILDSWRPNIHRLMNQLVDQVLPAGRMEMVKDISYQLPPIVISELLGLPPEDRDLLRQWTEPAAKLGSPMVGVDMVEMARQANAGMKALSEYLTRIVEERRNNLGDDIISLMLRTQEQGGMTMEELVPNISLLISAGHLTTTDQLANGIHDLLTHPEQLQMLRDNPLLLKSALEEIVRYHPAVPFIHRLAAETFTLHGKTIRKGDIVFLGMGAANRDPSVFPDPDRFDITRDSYMQKHIAFGFGPHHCLGAGLARRELELGIEVMLNRLPNLRLDEEHPPQVKFNSLLFRGFDSLHLRF
jgi:cytochrome P450 PksS